MARAWLVALALLGAMGAGCSREAPAPPAAPEGPPALNAEDQAVAFALARESVAHFLAQGTAPEPDFQRYPLTPGLKVKAGAFVTFYKRGELRASMGRIGYPGMEYFLPPVYETVRRMAMDAAIKDPRFPPITSDELPELRIEISLLSIAQPIESVEEFHPGEHGLVVLKDERTAVFLPQQIVEQGWDRTETLRKICEIAGLSPDEWREPGMTFHVFTAKVYQEPVQ